MRRRPAGRALTGVCSQSHPWLTSPEPAVPIERPTPGSAMRRFEALKARVAELEARDVIEVSSFASEEPRVVEL
ncbi:hypothetical protein ACWDRB_47285 [Nonomuraea sp. NPDC003707]